jgi:biotin carboxylase
MALTSARHHRFVPRVLLLLPSATYRAPDFLEAARTLGVEVVVGSEEPLASGPLMGIRAIQVPLADPPRAADTIVEHDEILPLDAVVAVDDQGTAAAAAASKLLGLRHNPPSAVLAARDKLVMRSMLEAGEVSQPAFAPIAAEASDETVASLAERVGLPSVIKPTTLSASQGVVRVDSAREAPSVARRVRRIATEAGVDLGEPLLLESFVAGPEVAVEGLLQDGELEVLAIFDKPDPLDGPAFEETIYVTPSRHDEPDTQAVIRATQAATRSLGLVEGPVHAELRVDGARAFVIEIAARTIGGLCSRALSFSTGRSLEQLVVAHALGLHLGSLELEGRASGVLMLPIPRAGTFLGVNRIPEALAVPGITDVQVTMARGRPVIPVPEGNRYVGFAFARAHGAKEVEHALRMAGSLLEVSVSPQGTAGEDGIEE